ncbi:NAD-dependent epimerase/dehydratase family protein [Dokdonella sp.]|uniref:NAD-dependent epimerase/dehydratase family protein n=1 Tax=Dokdonella sp. TaxID=2291710 RepID=UPI0031C96A77|nr:NAD-dependent epimerase/dehydratase family protein [Dokdonella sp.]
MSENVLLVGGDLCQRVALRLTVRDWNVWRLRRRAVTDPQVRWIQADVADPASLGQLPGAITHVLYAPAPDRREPASYQATYPQGLDNLLHALATHPLQRFVLVGSSVVWPPSPAQRSLSLVDESTPTQAWNFRAEALLQAESLLSGRLPECGVVLRLAGLYGPGRTRLLDALRSGRLTAPEGPGHWSNRIHIDDAASACVHLLTLPRPAPCYIGTDGNPTETAAFHDALAVRLDAPRPQRSHQPPSGKRLSNARLIASGWRPRWPDALAAYAALAAAERR